MANTTEENVLAIAPELGGISPAIITLILADVAAEIGTGYGTQQEQCQRYYAAHLLTLSNPNDKTRKPQTSGAIVSHRVGREQVQYANNRGNGDQDLQATSYGRRFAKLKVMALAGLRVVTPGGA